MGLKGFVQPGYYSKISSVIIDTDAESVNFTLRIMDEKGGVDVLPPMALRINREEEVMRYMEKHPPQYPKKPKYPAVCEMREAKVPMWTLGDTQAAKNEYNDAKAKYESAMVAYKSELDRVAREAAVKAKNFNTYEKYFAKRLMYETSNPLACAYTFVKSLDSFTGVNDA